MLDVDTAVEADWDDTGDWAALSREAVAAALSVTPHAGLLDKDLTVEVAVRLSNDEEVRALNAAYRKKDSPTNVLSFPMVQPDLIEGLTNSDDGEALLGDIILAYETCAREAVEKGMELTDHARHLIAHGTLHLLGYDHQADADAELMEALEAKALASLGLGNPYSHQ